MRVYTDTERDKKDFDLMVRPGDVERAMAAFRAAGFKADVVYSHWLAKVWHDGDFIDVIFRSGNGMCDVDDEWFVHSREAEIFGMRLPVCPPEELLWQKSFVMERERFDGADVQHLLLSCGATLDWARLLRRFGPNWPVLLSALILAGWVYPGQRSIIPERVMSELLSRLASEEPPTATQLCRGTLLSRLQYLEDVERFGYTDARTRGGVHMTRRELEEWSDEARRMGQSKA
jgi:hypothetical protein